MPILITDKYQHIPIGFLDDSPMNHDAITLDQIRVFEAVVETGSFSAAARRLNRAQSAVSYAIANLEAQLDALLKLNALLEQRLAAEVPA